MLEETFVQPRIWDFPMGQVGVMEGALSSCRVKRNPALCSAEGYTFKNRSLRKFAKYQWRECCLFGTNAAQRFLRRPERVSKEYPSVLGNNWHLNALHNRGPDIELQSAKRETQAPLPNKKTFAPVF